jgi:hypothetical protein
MKIGAKVKIKEDGSTVTSSFQSTSKEEVNKNNNNRAYFNFINSIRSPLSRKTYEFTLKKYTQYYNIQNINQLLIDKDNPTISFTIFFYVLVADRRYKSPFMLYSFIFVRNPCGNLVTFIIA